MFMTKLREIPAGPGKVNYIQVDDLKVDNHFHLDMTFVGLDYDYVDNSVIIAWRDDLAKAVNSFKAKKENAKLKKEGPIEPSGGDH